MELSNFSFRLKLALGAQGAQGGLGFPCFPTDLADFGLWVLFFGAPLWKGTGHLDVRVSLRDGGTFQALFRDDAYCKVKRWVKRFR